MNECSNFSIKEVRSQIETLITDSENLYLSFGSTFPLFVKELQTSLSSSRSAFATLGEGNSLPDAMAEIFRSTQNLLNQASDRFKDLHQRDAQQIESLNRTISTLKNLDEVIEKIRDDSMEMELISLNAMTVAYKSGAAGRAFSVITEELKRLSGQTIRLTDQLNEDGQRLIDFFTRYRGDVEGLVVLQDQFFTNLGGRIAASFDALRSPIESLGLSLMELIDTSEQVEEPVHIIMETVQIQDILRQSLDHVVMALQEVETAPPPPADSKELCRDFYIFRSQLYTLSENILQDVLLRIRKSRSVLEKQTHRIEKIIEQGEGRRRSLLRDAFNAQDPHSVVSAFGQSSGMLERLKDDMGLYLRSKNSILVQGERLFRAVGALEKRFQGFDKLLNRFRTIDVAARIEVSKEKILRQMNDTVSEMSQLIETIAADVNRAMVGTKNFITDSQGIVDTYSNTSGDEAGLIEPAEKQLHVSYQRLGTLRASIQEGLEHFSLFTGDFLNLVKGASKNVEALDQMGAGVESIMKELTRLDQEIKRDMDQLGIEETLEGPRSERLKEIISRFTIYAHKQAAAEIGGFSMDSEAHLTENEAGSITYF